MNFNKSKLYKTFNNKIVLITGHTGFKGTWLTIWLLLLGAKVVGISKDIPTKISHFKESKIKKKITDLRININDGEKLKKVIKNANPDFVFHMAAQPLVRKSYSNPIETWETNLLGTVNVLESLKNLKKKCTAIIITSDKCYKNKEWVWGYKENDELGGPDPYSASKGAAEIAIRSYYESYFKNSNIRISSVRAGNVIGGGDWAEDRIVPDCMRAWSDNKTLIIRNPKATRPWQHVLEPLSGYLTLAVKLSNDKNISGESFNFGPNFDDNYSVSSVLEELKVHWPKNNWKVKKTKNKFHESSLLKLNCDKSLSFLNWTSTLQFNETIRLTSEWYKRFNNKENTMEVTKSQIIEYCNIALEKKLKWIA